MDTIFALSTAPARSGVAVIRISGKDAHELLGRVFRTRSAMAPRVMTLGVLRDRDGETVDRCLAVIFSGRASYTGEDSAELHLHGSPAVISAALEALAEAGGRPAEAGEFTKRAFLNGKLDLSEAEAVGELIAAETSDAARNAAAMLGGALAGRLRSVYDELTDILSHLAAEVDYPEEDVDPLTRRDAIEGMFHVEHSIEEILSRSELARAFTHGVECVILGAPNAGKSTLFNAILGEERAIVTSAPGTTRDLLREHTSLGGVPLRLTDTAGLRDANDEAERIGVSRAETEAASSALALLCIDRSAPPALEETRRAVRAAKSAGRAIVVATKCDLPPDGRALQTISAAAAELRCGTVELSLLSADGEEKTLLPLEEELRRLYDRGSLRFDGTLLSSARQFAVALAALEASRSAREALEHGVETDVALTDAERAASRLGELFGRAAPQDIIDKVFANFCVGK